MRRNFLHPLLWIAIGTGIALRMTDIMALDFMTDETQLALGRSAAWTPLAMNIMVFVQSIFGFEMIVARGVSVLFGIAALPVIYAIALHLTDKKTALLTTALAALFPGHVIYSRLAFPSIQMAFAWLICVLAFLKTQDTRAVTLSSACTEPAEVPKGYHRATWLIVLFASGMTASLMKSQGLLLPLCFLGGRIWTKKKAALRDDVAWTLVLSLIPAGLYILTHPGVLATVILYKDSMYGIHSSRFLTLLTTWFTHLHLFFIAGLASIFWFRKTDWPVWMMIIMGIFTGFILGPHHDYYTVHAVLIAFPIARMLLSSPRIIAGTVGSVLLLGNMLFLAPHSLSPWSHPFYNTHQPYWNTHAEQISRVLEGEDRITVVGAPGHHLRWYFCPEIIVDRDLKPPYETPLVLYLDQESKPTISGDILYEDERVTVVRQN